VRESMAHVRLEKNGDANIAASLDFRGRAASVYTGALLRQSKEHVDHVIITSLTDEDRLKSSEIDSYDLSSRVTQDFSIKARFTEARYSMRTTVGPAFYLDQRIFDHLIRLDTRKRVSDMFLGHPDVIRDTDFLVNVRLVGAKPPECVIDAPWLKATRKVTQTAGGLKIINVREIKRSLISNEELKSPEFAKFQAALTQCFDRVAVVYEPLKGKQVPGAPRAISSVDASK
jgi:hypothetical protein